MITRRGLLGALLGGAAGALLASVAGRITGRPPMPVEPVGRVPFENNSLVQRFGDTFPLKQVSQQGDIFMSTWPGREGVYMHHGDGNWELMRDLPHQLVDEEMLAKMPPMPTQECGHLTPSEEGGPICYTDQGGGAVQHRPMSTDTVSHADRNARHIERVRVASARADDAIAEEVRRCRPRTHREYQACRHRALQKIGVHP